MSDQKGVTSVTTTTEKRARQDGWLQEPHTGWLGSTPRLSRRVCAAEPGTELKSPATSIGISALAAIFSSPFSSVFTYTRTRVCFMTLHINNPPVYIYKTIWPGTQLHTVLWKHLSPGLETWPAGPDSCPVPDSNCYTNMGMPPGLQSSLHMLTQVLLPI